MVARTTDAMAGRILVVEDERDLQRVLLYNLKQAGFDVVSALDGETALRAVREARFDLILLDLMLPDMPGTEVCRTLKQDQTTAIPVVMVTAKGEEIDRVVGFELGRDDYVVKPFSVRELMLRVNARAPPIEDAPSRPTVRFEFGELRRWIPRRTAPGSTGAEVALTALEFRLLVTLYERRGPRAQPRAAPQRHLGHRRATSRRAPSTPT